MARNSLARAAVVAALSVCGAARASESWVRFSGDGKHILVSEQGIESFAGVSSAVYRTPDGEERAGIRDSSTARVQSAGTVETPLGEAELFHAHYENPGSPFRYTVSLKRLKDSRVFTLQGVFHNSSGRDVRLQSFDLLDTRREEGGRFGVANPAEWLVTPLMQDADAVTLDVAKQRLDEAAMLYRANGDGFLVGPVGPAEAYTSVHFIEQQLVASARMDGVLVRAGESRRSEEVAFFFTPAATATKLWTSWVAATHGARLHRGPAYGWCSWYDQTTKITESHLLEVAGVMREHPNVFGRGTIQIDDGYQKMDGDWSANEKFPSTMAGMAAKIREAGFVPGVWIAPLMIDPEHPWGKANPDAIQKNAEGISSFMNANPFHPKGANWINPDHPESKKFLRRIVADARENGYGYLKIDFNGIGTRFVDPTKTQLQVFRELYAGYREAAGEQIYLLACLGKPNRGVIGFADACRVGPDSHPAHFDKCLKSVLRFQIYHGAWWQNDPDVSYLAPKLPSRKLGPTPQGEGMWRTWHSVVALAGGTAMISEPIQNPDAREHWRNFGIMRPSSGVAARLLTLGHGADNALFGFSSARPYGTFAVCNLYNPAENTRPVTLDFGEAGLPSGVRCAVYDFWENRVVGYATDSFTTAPLQRFSSALLRFTPLEEGRPVLVGSNLHLSMGATEIADLRVAADGIRIMLTDAGAQDGSLFFHSQRRLSAAGSENCQVGSVESLGDNLWKVNVTDRKWGTAQTLRLGLF